jgi:hypothetical protein
MRDRCAALGNSGLRVAVMTSEESRAGGELMRGARSNSPRAYEGTGYFCATVGAVDEATFKACIENKKWNDDEEGFKITAPTEPLSRLSAGAVLQTALAATATFGSVLMLRVSDFSTETATA